MFGLLEFILVNKIFNATEVSHLIIVWCHLDIVDTTNAVTGDKPELITMVVFCKLEHLLAVLERLIIQIIFNKLASIIVVHIARVVLRDNRIYLVLMLGLLLFIAAVKELGGHGLGSTHF